MVDRYWRKIESVENNIENSMQISSILLKLKEYDEKLGGLSKIENNENNISFNLGKIDTNKNDISSNLGKIKELNQNKIYLKNISNDILYNEDTQINVSNDQSFFEKEYNILFKK